MPKLWRIYIQGVQIKMTDFLTICKNNLELKEAYKKYITQRRQEITEYFERAPESKEKLFGAQYALDELLQELKQDYPRRYRTSK